MGKALERLSQLDESGILSEAFFQSLVNEHDPFLKVSRSIHLMCTDKGIKLQKMFSGVLKPSEFNVAILKPYKHPLQKRGETMRSGEAYKSLKASGLIYHCIELGDLNAIWERGLPFRQKYFPTVRLIFGWGDLSRGEDGNDYLPVLFEDEPVKWERVNEGFLDRDCISPYFPSAGVI